MFLSSVGLSVLLSHVSRYDHTHSLADINMRLVESSQYLFHSPLHVTVDDREKFPEPRGRNLTKEDVKLLVNPRYSCAKASLVVCVISAPANVERRNLIRETWGHPEHSANMAVLFILGKPSSENLMNEIGDESFKYGDMVIGAFQDHYENLTIKSVVAYGWSYRYCNATFILKVDDDVLVKVFTLQTFINDLKLHNDTSGVIFCAKQQSSPPYRKGKYGVSEWEYSGKVYPPFCSGPAYLMSRDVTSAIYEAAVNRPMFRLEDVYLTGFLRHKLGFYITQGYKAYANGVLLERMFQETHILFGHSQNNTSKFRKMWKNILRSKS